MQKKVTIVGGGLGGMAGAVMLARAGFQVDLFEKNPNLGGKLNVLKRDGFSFDLGPSIFTLPQIFAPVFESEGKTLQDYVNLKRVDPQWRNFFEDGTTIDLYEKLTDMEAELAKLSPESFGDYCKFLDYSKIQYDVTERGYFNEGLDGFWDFFKFYGLRGAKDLDFLRSMSGGIARYVSHPKLRDILADFIKYVGSSANDAPGFMNLMPTIQTEFGLWYVQGGMYELARAFEKRLAETGVRVHLNAEVLEMRSTERRVKSLVVAEGGIEKNYACDFVLSNMEVIPAYQKLLRERASFLKKLERFEPACSGIVLHLGVKKIYPQLAHHNFFYSKNQSKHFDRVFHEKKLPDDPTIYLVAPTRSDASQAPEGCDNIKILPHIPYLNEKSPYTYADCVALKERVIDKLERMGLHDLRRHKVVEDFWTPFDIEKKYYSNRGSIYGVVSDLRRNYAFKAPKKSSRYDNLYFAGGSVNPGGGMPMVVLSGRHAARLIVEAAGQSA